MNTCGVSPAGEGRRNDSVADDADESASFGLGFEFGYEVEFEVGNEEGGGRTKARVSLDGFRVDVMVLAEGSVG